MLIGFKSSGKGRILISDFRNTSRFCDFDFEEQNPLIASLEISSLDLDISDKVSVDLALV